MAVQETRNLTRRALAYQIHQDEAQESMDWSTTVHLQRALRSLQEGLENTYRASKEAPYRLSDHRDQQERSANEIWRRS